MPLSDHEQKLLEQMERALYAEDPKFATQMKGSVASGGGRSRLLVGVIAAVLGLALVVVGVTTELIVVGGLGFAVMVAGVAWALAPPRQKARLGAVQPDGGVAPPKQGKGRASKRRRRSSGSFMQRMEQRWEKRRRDGRI